jgi:hypothetical protein
MKCFSNYIAYLQKNDTTFVFSFEILGVIEYVNHAIRNKHASFKYNAHLSA